MAQVVVKSRIPSSPIVVEAFPSKGFVSTIAANQIIREMGMKLVGFIDSEEMEGIAVIRDSHPVRPMRVYQKDRIFLLYSEVMVPFNSIAKVSSAINSWLDRIKPKKVVLMAGITGIENYGSHEIVGLASSPELAKELEALKVRILKDGVLTGVASSILIHCTEKKIPAVGLMAETQYTPDAVAAASMLELLNKLLKTNINHEELKRMGKDVEEEFRKVIKQMKKGREGYGKLEENGPMYC
jgi:uncharacterized protein